jgi:hypothetical protein
MKRATISFALPAANGTMNLIVLAGYWACAGADPATTIASAIKRLPVVILMNPPRLLSYIHIVGNA